MLAVFGAEDGFLSVNGSNFPKRGSIRLGWRVSIVGRLERLRTVRRGVFQLLDREGLWSGRSPTAYAKGVVFGEEGAVAGEIQGSEGYGLPDKERDGTGYDI